MIGSGKKNRLDTHCSKTECALRRQEFGEKTEQRQAIVIEVPRGGVIKAVFRRRAIYPIAFITLLPALY